MSRARDDIIRRQLSRIVEPYDREPVSRALSQIAFTVLPDWGEFQVESWMIDGLKPIFSQLFELSGPLQVELLECLSLLYKRNGVQPDFDLCELKERLHDLSVLPCPTLFPSSLTRGVRRPSVICGHCRTTSTATFGRKLSTP